MQVIQMYQLFAFAGGIEARVSGYIGDAAYLECVKMGPSSSGPMFSHSLNGHVYYGDDLVAEDFDRLSTKSSRAAYPIYQICE